MVKNNVYSNLTPYNVGDILYSDEFGWHILLVRISTLSHPYDNSYKLVDWEVIVVETGETNWYEQVELEYFFEKVA